MIPTPVWIILALCLMVGIYWWSDDIGSWWEKRTQAKVDKAIAEKQVQIDELIKQRDVALFKAAEAETREQGKILEADLLKQEAAKRGINIQNAQTKIDNALTEYSTNLEVIEKVKTGEISKLQLCQSQCQISAEQGYPCRPNYCEPFK